LERKNSPFEHSGPESEFDLTKEGKRKEWATNKRIVIENPIGMFAASGAQKQSTKSSFLNEYKPAFIKLLKRIFVSDNNKARIFMMWTTQRQSQLQIAFMMVWIMKTCLSTIRFIMLCPLISPGKAELVFMKVVGHDARSFS
jgi:hypothetical protein